MATVTTLVLTDDEVFLLYALTGREVAECALEHIGGGIAGPHREHKPTANSALAKLADAVTAIQEHDTKEQ